MNDSDADDELTTEIVDGIPLRLLILNLACEVFGDRLNSAQVVEAARLFYEFLHEPDPEVTSG